jgi:hypothetical protein
MSGKRHVLRGERGRFAAAQPKAAVGTELKRARGAKNGGRPQIRKKHKRALTNGDVATFLASLAETCNVSHAARTAKRSARIF